LDDPTHEILSGMNSARDENMNNKQIYFSSNERLDLIIQTSE